MAGIIEEKKLTDPSDFFDSLTEENKRTYLSEEEMHEYPYLGNYNEFTSLKNENLSTIKEN